MNSRVPTAVDLFCGCGGLSAGLRMAGFRILAGVDIEPRYMATFTHNFPEAHSFCLDLSKTPPSSLMERLRIEPSELTLLAGGPPCQGFSKNVPRRRRYLDSPNNKLVKTFLDYCERLKPKLILMENVAEMKNGFDQTYTDEILSRLKEAGYTVTHGVLNAADYGIPQRRRRAFFIASRDGIRLEFPKPTHAPHSNEGFLFKMPAQICVWDAIGDLPPLKHGEGKPVCEYACEPFSDYQRLMRNGAKFVTNHVARRLQPIQYERLASLLPGQGLTDLPKHLRPKSGYSGAYGRLTKDMVAPTITRWVFHPGSGRWGHPVDIRVLTIREVARIQGFPDSFHFVGTYTQQAAQVGNAVPPLLAARIAESLLKQIQVSSPESSFMNFSTSIRSSEVGSLNLTA